MAYSPYSGKELDTRLKGHSWAYTTAASNSRTITLVPKLRGIRTTLAWYCSRLNVSSIEQYSQVSMRLERIPEH